MKMHRVNLVPLVMVAIVAPLGPVITGIWIVSMVASCSSMVLVGLGGSEAVVSSRLFEGLGGMGLPLYELGGVGILPGTSDKRPRISKNDKHKITYNLGNLR